jgi:hypothetical protein
MKVMLCVHRWNIDKDRCLAKVLGIEESRKLGRYLHKALQHYSSSYGGKMKYPPGLSLSDEFDVKHGWEPIGHHYSRYNRWQQIDNAVQMHNQVNTNPRRSDQTDDAPSVGAGANEGSSSLPATAETPNIAPTSRAPTTTPDTENTAHSPAASSSAINSSLSSSIPPATHWNEALGRRGGTALPAANWSRHLGGRTPTVNAFNTFLPKNKPLSNNQPAHFWNIVSDLHQVQNNNNGPSGIGLGTMTQKIAEAWETQHYKVMSSGESSDGF